MAGQRSSADKRYGRQAGGTGVFCIFRGRYSALGRSSRLGRSGRSGRLSALLTPAADTAVFDSGNSCRYHPFYRRARSVLPAAERDGGRSTGADHAEPPARRYSVPWADGVAVEWWGGGEKTLDTIKNAGAKTDMAGKGRPLLLPSSNCPQTTLKLSSDHPQNTLKIPQIIPSHPDPPQTSPARLAGAAGQIAAQTKGWTAPGRSRRRYFCRPI